jgi:hypothetical protein
MSQPNSQPGGVCLHCKKELAVFPSPAGMSLITLFLGGMDLVFSRPERVWSVTSRLGTGKWLTLFYSVVTSRLGTGKSLTLFYSVLCCVEVKAPSCADDGSGAPPTAAGGPPKGPVPSADTASNNASGSGNQSSAGAPSDSSRLH